MMSEPKDPDDRIDNVVNLLDLKGGANKGQYLVLQRLLPGGNKPPYGTVSNAMVILSHDPTVAGLLGFNEFTGQYLLLRSPPVSEDGDAPLPGPYPRQWDSADVSLILAHIQRIWCAKMTRSSVEEAMLAEASRRRFHPVRDWLASLKWDGVPRLDRWLNLAFGVPHDDYSATVGAKFLIAAVRRVRRPGCKFDCLPVLEGDQGLGKSKGCRLLFGSDWFSDSMHHDFGSKDAPISLIGVWGMELAEIQQMIRAEVEVFKAFLSRPVDRYRPPYAKAAIDVPRQSVMIGTTNARDYLRDTTGNRRVWPLRCRHVDEAWIENNRTQLWAEAAMRETSGETLWLDDDDTRKSAEQAQEERMLDDAWAEKVWEYVGLSTRVRVADILGACLNLGAKDQDRKAQMRVAEILSRRKWKVRVVREGVATPRYWFHPSHEDYPA